MKSLEWLKEMWGSWKLLVGGFIATATLWLIPKDWITDSAVAAVRDTYHGIVGFVALGFLTVLGARIVVEAPGFIRWAFLRLRQVRMRYHRRQQGKARRIRRIPKLHPEARALLRECLEKDSQVFECPPRNGGPESMLHSLGYVSIVEAEMGDPTHTFRVNDWTWDYIQKNPTSLEDPVSSE